MTTEQFLNGRGETFAERDIRINRERWMAYQGSQEHTDEIEVLMEMDSFDGPTGDAW